MYKLTLASNSPRRKDLLTQIGYTFECFNPDVDENINDLSISNEELPVFLSKLKAKAALNYFPERTIIAADTIVVFNNKVFNKPKDVLEATQMLKELSNNTHQVITGVTIQTQDSFTSFSDISLVTFSDLSDDEISFYIDKYKPFDKAGSYGAQDWLGLVGIKKIEGSYFTVMGLPIHLLYQKLKEFNIYAA